MEFRCVIAVMRHGYRTPKQKMKMEIRNKFLIINFPNLIKSSNYFLLILNRQIKSFVHFI